LGGGGGWREVGDGFEGGYFIWREVDVVVFFSAEKEAGVAVDGGVVIAAEGETVLERDALGGVGGRREDGEGGEGDEAGVGERGWHGNRVAKGSG
jgi:hypothetical protein